MKQFDDLLVKARPDFKYPLLLLAHLSALAAGWATFASSLPARDSKLKPELLTGLCRHRFS